MKIKKKLTYDAPQVEYLGIDSLSMFCGSADASSSAEDFSEIDDVNWFN